MTLDKERDLSKYAALLTAAKTEQDRGDLKVQLTPPFSHSLITNSTHFVQMPRLSVNEGPRR